MTLSSAARAVLVPIMFTASMSVHAAAGPNMKPGLYEITVKMDMPGMPQAMPETKTQRCVTSKDMEDPRKIGPGDDARTKSTCEVANYRMQGNTATWSMACKGPEQMTGTGSVTYDANGYKGVNRMSMKQGKETLDMTMNYSGRYLGECKGAPPKR